MPVDVRSKADIFAEMDKIAAEAEEQQRKRFAEMDKIAEMTGFKVSGAEESLPKPTEQRKLPEGADIITLPLHERASQIKKVDERTQPSSEYVKALTEAVNNAMDQQKRGLAALRSGAMDSFASMGHGAGWLLNELGADTVSGLAMKGGDWLRDKSASISKEALGDQEPGLYDAVLRGVGSTGAFLLPGVGAAKLANLGRLGTIAATAASKGGLEAISEGGSVFKAQREHGSSDEEARSAARKTGISQFPINFITDLVWPWQPQSRLAKALVSGGSELIQETLQAVTSDKLSERKEDKTPYTWEDYAKAIPEMAGNIPEAVLNEGLPAFLSSALLGAATSHPGKQPKQEQEQQKPAGVPLDELVGKIKEDLKAQEQAQQQQPQEQQQQEAQKNTLTDEKIAAMDEIARQAEQSAETQEQNSVVKESLTVQEQQPEAAKKKAFQERGELLKWAKGELDSMTEAAKFADDESNTADNALTEEDLRRFHDIKEARKRHDYETLARMRDEAFARQPQQIPQPQPLPTQPQQQPQQQQQQQPSQQQPQAYDNNVQLQEQAEVQPVGIPKMETTTQAPVEITQEVTPTVGQSGLSNIQPNHIGDVNEMAGSAEQQQPQAIQSPEKSDTKRGKQSKVVTPAGDNVETVFKLAEADDLIASNKSNFELNEKYPQELQPRQRGRMASQQQIEGIISKLNPELLGESTLASDGAPIVGNDNVVESGNGRVLALKLMYERGGATAAQAAKYKQYLVDNAEKFGLSADEVNSMKRPVMVRERTSEIDRKAFTQNANVSNMAAMSSSEMAARDAETLNNETLGLINPDTDILSNREFIKEFAREVVQQNERGTFMDERGNISQDGLRRITNALFMKAYGDNRTLARMGEAVDDNTRNINKALLQAAPTIAQMQEKIKQGTLKADLSLAPHVVEAVNKLSQLRAEGKKVAEFLSERSLFDDNEISPEAKEILKFLDKNKQRPNVITNFLLDTARAIENEGNPDQLKLFDTKDSSLHDIVNEMAEKHKTQRAAESPRLFDQKETPEETHRRVHGDIKEQLIKTGMKEEEATANADILTAGLEASAKRESSGLGDFYKKLKLTFTKGDAVKGQDPNQVYLQAEYFRKMTAEELQNVGMFIRSIPPEVWGEKDTEKISYYLENIFDEENPATWGVSEEELKKRFGVTPIPKGYDIDKPKTWLNQERANRFRLLELQIYQDKKLPPEIVKIDKRLDELETAGKDETDPEIKKLKEQWQEWHDASEKEMLELAEAEDDEYHSRTSAIYEAGQTLYGEYADKLEEAGGETFYQTASKDVDREYFAALEAGDMETVQRIVDEQAAKMEYSSDSGYRMNHKAPNREYGVNIPGLKGSDLVPEDYWTHPNYYQSDAEEYESFRKVKMALNSNIGVIRMYRAVPKNIKESSFRNGDWITPSRAYAELEGQGIVEGYRIITQSVKTKDVWWDGNSICEFGYDDGSSYAYRDTKNNRKLTDAVVKDEDGQVVPPSKRFNLRKAETFYQTAWHGSPHRFDGFDISKIGTGEGAQVYGWGLYFAQSRDIADSHYRKRLVNEAKAAPDVYWNGEKLVSKSFGWGSTEISTEDRIIMALSKNNYDIDRAAKSAKEHLEKLLADKTPDEHAALKEEIQKERSVVEALESGAVTVESRIDENETGQLYKVDVPEDDVLLDYDKPFPEQTQFVKDALQPFIDKYIETEGRVGIGVDYLYATGKEIQEAIASNLRDGNILEDGTIPADKVKNNLKIDRKSKEVSVFLKNIGIVGVKYLDGNSRSKGEGSYNFVVFDDKAIQVLETFYQSSMLNDETLLQYDKNSAEWINAVSQLIENASDEGYTRLYLRAMIDENNADHNHVKGERLEESRYWGDMLSEEEEKSGEREDVTLGGTSTIFIDEDLSGNPEDWAAELYKKINAASNYAGPLAIVGVNEDMDNAEGIMYRHSFSGEDKYEQVLPNARFYGYVHELLGKAFEKEKKYAQTQQKQDGEVKGSITLPGKLGSAPVNINLTKLSDPSTAPHEMGHLFLWILENQAREQTGNAEIQTALQAVKDFVGRKSDEASFSDNQHEKFANGFMTYVSEGKAPNSRLEKAFKQFKKWLADLWDSLTGNPKVKLTPEIRKVFDWLLTGDAAFDVRYDLDNAIERAQELNGKTYFQVTVEPRQRDTSNDTRMMDMVNSPNIVAERHARFRPFFRMAKEAYQQQEAMRGNWQRAADGIFGRNGFFGRKGGIIQTDAQRETLTEILLQGDALETVFTDAELQNLGADTDVVRAYRRIRSLYDNTHRLVSAQRQRYGRDAMAYREGYVPHFFHTWRVIRDGQILNTFRSMREAVRAANELQDSEGGDYRVVPAMHDFQGQDQLDAVIMGDRAYLRLLHNFEEAFGMDARTAQLLLQNVARRQPRSRFFGNALQRRGIDGWDTNMEYALRHYLNFSARYIAMDTLKHDGINLFERAFGRFRSEHTGLAHYTKKYLEAALGNPSNVEETLNNWIRESWLGQYIRDYIGDRPATMAANTLAKGIAVSKLGFLNMTTAAMNITQLIGTNAIIGERYTVRGIREYLRPNAHTRAVYRALGIEESMNLESPSGYSRAHNMAGLLGDASMGAFRLLDSMARKVTAIGAYRRGIDQGMNHAAAIEYARQVNDDVNFDYSVADSPHFMRQSGPIGTLLFQFKKYPIKMMELALPGVGKLRGMQQVRFWVPFLAMTGLFGLPGFDALKEWIKAMFSGKDIELEVKKFIGTSKMPQRLKDTMLYGAFANLGIDVGKRTGMGDFIPADIGDLTGPAISTIGQLTTAIPKIFDNGNFMDTIEAISPGLANPLKAWLGETKDKRRGRLQFEYQGMGEKTARALGARPLREAKERDAARVADYEQRKRSDAEHDAIDNFIRIYSKGNTQSAEYEKARARLGELRIDPARVKREMSAKNLSGYDRKLKQYTTKKGYQNMQMMQQYMGN